MKNINEIDKNFEVKNDFNKNDIKFYDVNDGNFCINGVFYENGRFRRIPEDVAKSVSEGVYFLHSNTAGGRVRFKTNSTYVAISVKMQDVGKMGHFALCGSSGFDLYVDNDYYNSFVPPFDIIDGYQSIINFSNNKMRDITINFPLYSAVTKFYIGLQKNAILSNPTPYKLQKPIVYYGSSITQGGCASRPGSSYEAIISRYFNADYINLGFSGNAKAEDEIINYINTLDMSVFVFDYDHNAPSIEHLKNTHEKAFLKIREKHPNLPIIMASRPKYHLTKDEKQRLNIIKTTYNNALLRGDKNVYFIDGKTLMKLAKDEGTVDSCHPTDLGFFSMASQFIRILKKII